MFEIMFIATIFLFIVAVGSIVLVRFIGRKSDAVQNCYVTCPVAAPSHEVW